MKPFKFLSTFDFIRPQENHMILNVCKECITNVTKALITGKTKLIESELETAKFNMGIHGTEKFRVRYIPLCKHYYACIYK